MTITARPIRLEDFAQWVTLWENYNTFYKRTLAEEVTRTTWSRFFDVYEPVHSLVADKAGKLIGFTNYLFHRSTSMVRATCYLQDLYTDEAARRQGVGRALIEAVYQRATDAGCQRVYWQTHETNATARRLYDRVAERSGFIVYSKKLGLSGFEKK